MNLPLLRSRISRLWTTGAEIVLISGTARLQNTADSRSHKYSRTGPFGPEALAKAGRILPVKTRDRSHLSYYKFNTH